MGIEKMDDDALEKHLVALETDERILRARIVECRQHILWRRHIKIEALKREKAELEMTIEALERGG